MCTSVYDVECVVVLEWLCVCMCVHVPGLCVLVHVCGAGGLLHPRCPCECAPASSVDTAECTPCTWGFLRCKYWAPSERQAQPQTAGCFPWRGESTRAARGWLRQDAALWGWGGGCGTREKGAEVEVRLRGAAAARSVCLLSKGRAEGSVNLGGMLLA